MGWYTGLHARPPSLCLWISRTALCGSILLLMRFMRNCLLHCCHLSSPSPWCAPLNVLQEELDGAFVVRGLASHYEHATVKRAEEGLSLPFESCKRKHSVPRDFVVSHFSICALLLRHFHAPSAIMTFLTMDKSAHQEDTKQSQLQRQAEVPMKSDFDESQVGEPSHHEAVCGSLDISTEWPDWSDDVLSMWRSLDEPNPSVDPIVNIESPRSPTGVDCLQLETKWKREDISELLERTSNSGDAKDSFDDAAKLRALLDLWQQEDSILNDSGSEDSVLDELVSDDQVSEDFKYKESHRVRQRGYEKKHKTKKRESLKSLRKRWLSLETEFYCTHLQKKAKALVTNPHATPQERIEEKLQEEQARQRDVMLLESAWAWRIMFSMRNYSITETELAKGRIPEDEKPPEDTEESAVDAKPVIDKSGSAEKHYKAAFEAKNKHVPEEILRSMRRWTAIDRTIFEDSDVKPFLPLHVEFDW